MNIHATNIYAPNETSLLGIKQSEKAGENAAIGIELDIKGTDPAVKDYFAPLLPWEICAVQAQTSNGKTMFTNFWVRQIAEQLKRDKRDEVIVYVSLEESIEAMAFTEFGRILDVRPADIARGSYKDRSKLLMAKSEIDGVPIWRIAESAETPENAPDLTLSNIYRAIQELTQGNVTGEKWKPAVVVVDYLQILPIDNEVKKAKFEDQRRLQVDADVKRLRKMTTHLQCPIIVPLQAKQELKGNNPPFMIPGTYDGLETSGIATRFDRIMSLWLPKTIYPVGSIQSNKNNPQQITVKENQAFLKVNKQRGGLPAGMVWELRVDYTKQEYTDAYTKAAK
jgi:replicative DNA helicase